MCYMRYALFVAVSCLFHVHFAHEVKLVLLPPNDKTLSPSGDKNYSSVDAVESGVVMVAPVGPQYVFGTPSTAWGHIRGQNLSHVVCSDLGKFGSVLKSSEEWLAEPSAAVVWFDDVVCVGNESWIGDCNHSGLGRGDVLSGDPVIGVTCYFEEKVGDLDGKQCKDGYHFNESVGSGCTRCDVGMFLNELGICTNCTAGMYKSSPGDGPCTSCPVGKYQDRAGAPACSSCPVGYHNPNEGSGTPNACGRCPEGFGTGGKIGQWGCSQECQVGDVNFDGTLSHPIGEECEQIKQYDFAVMAIFKNEVLQLEIWIGRFDYFLWGRGMQN